MVISTQNSKPVRGRPFPNGVSGNPGGRPKGVAEVMELARQHSVAAIETLAEIMAAGESEQARIAAATVLLDRAWGKPVQPLLHGGDEREESGTSVLLQSFSIEELRELLAKTGEQKALPPGRPGGRENGRGARR